MSVSERNRYALNIFGSTVKVVSDEPEDHVRKSAFIVDSTMREVATRLGDSDKAMLAILSALRIASGSNILENEAVDCRLRIRKLIETIDSTLSG